MRLCNGLKRSMPCSNLATLNSLGDWDFDEAEWMPASSDLDSVKRIKLSTASSLTEEEIPYVANVSISEQPATAALEEALAFANESIELQIELLGSNTSDSTTNSSNTFMSKSKHFPGYTVDYSLKDAMYQHVYKTPEPLMSRFHHGPHEMRDVSNIFAMMTTSACT
ncbi:hypothetical protein FisN_5Hh487 [Fistulifera solaris]|uniref:Uncharacterized protein n=1 Tax=Fistulifera solaris TaxID=1519565 RepID=A0A1Z5JTK8_FISSO|nr:hypothetical protein FisN_5Hh487 [Fistulifera solaris]|eukprot:GAX17101.1 hypothetical protein FisN_5Hh487 [Fistulifera solaris]